ncbi:MAG: hypothetical protein HGB35_08010 [Geobacteraceae bacterium]|nr:hypothetical protein [Geobacteraceae bacterium]
MLIALNGGISEYGNDAAADIVGGDVTIDIIGSPAYDLGSVSNMVEISTPILRLGNSSRGDVYFDMNGTANHLPGKTLPAGLILDPLHMPRLVVCGSQIIGGFLLTDIHQSIDAITAGTFSELSGLSTLPGGFSFYSLTNPLLFGNADSETLKDGVIK